MAVVESRPRPLRPWSPAVRAMLDAPGLRYAKPVHLTDLHAGAVYFLLAAYSWAVYLCTDGTVQLVTRPWVHTPDAEVATHTFPTLHEAYLTGMLLFPEDFLPIGH